MCGHHGKTPTVKNCTPTPSSQGNETESSHIAERVVAADLQNQWAVRSYVGGCGCVALICTIAAVALLVDLVV